jgi:hypothetical protein
LKEYNLVNGLLFAATGSCSCFVLGYLASVCAPGARKNIDGLTVYTLNLLEKPK